MLFNSINFVMFLPVVFILYWFVFNKTKYWQNFILIISSYFFYATWDWRFLLLLIFSTVLDFCCALLIEKSNSTSIKKQWLMLAIIINLGFLSVFKYYDFFAVSMTTFLHNFGFSVNPILLNLILPIGISFYTFHGLSYVIDVYYQRITTEKNFVDYALFVSYFPLLVAGPIERATHLLPQLKKLKVFNQVQATQGIKLIIWGLFKKIVVADNCAFFVNQIFENSGSFSSLELWFGMFLFSFQIYGDFSGYSDIARGVSKLFGIELLHNFNFPYFSKDIGDFWRRWHISLSSWFKDYVYIPLGGSKTSKYNQLRNVFVIFLLSGFWHGANWTFLAWGFLHALFFIPLLLLKINRVNINNSHTLLRLDFLKIVLTFIMVSFAWIFFRSATLIQAYDYIERLFDLSKLDISFFTKSAKNLLLATICLMSIFFLIIIEYRNYIKRLVEIQLSKKMIFILLLMLFSMSSFRNQLSFIYFQF